MANYETFITQLEKEIREGSESKEVLIERAWAWYDTQSLGPDEDGRVRRAIEDLFGLELGSPTPKPRFTDLLSPNLYPKSGWLSDYLRYTTFCGAPLPFHFFCGAGILGAVLRRNAWIPFGRSPTYGAMYIVLVAPPGMCFKSTAVGIGVGLLRESGLVEIISGRATPEGISDVLSTMPDEAPKDAIAMIAASELYRFLAGHNAPSNNQTISALTSWYDAQDVDDDITITRKKRKLHNIAISLLGGTTLEWLVESLPKSVFAGGFMSRVLFINQEYAENVSSIAPPDDPLQRIKLLEDLNEIVETFKGPIDLCPDAYKFYDHWFHTHHEQLRKSDERQADFYQRRPDYVRKLSLILAASQKHDCITFEDMKMSTELLEMLNPSLNELITPMTLGDQAHEIEIVRRTMEKHGEMSRTMLVRRCSARGIDVEKLDKALNTLRQGGLLDMKKSGARGGQVYIWTRRRK